VPDRSHHASAWTGLPVNSKRNRINSDPETSPDIDGRLNTGAAARDQRPDPRALWAAPVERSRSAVGWDRERPPGVVDGLVVPTHTWRTFVAKRSGLTRGDRRRNERIAAVRAVVRSDRAILAIDLGEDRQVAALVDHEGRVVGRRSLKAKAHGLGGLLGWAQAQATGQGFAGVVVGCEPTGHRWRAVMALADAAGMGFVCVQALRVHLAREADDYTRDKTDPLTELRRGRGVVAGRVPARVSTVCGRGRWRRRGAGSVPLEGCGGRVAAAHWGSVRAVPAG